MKYQEGDSVKLLSEKTIDGIAIPTGAQGVVTHVLSAMNAYKIDFSEKAGVLVAESELRAS